MSDLLHSFDQFFSGEKPYNGGGAFGQQVGNEPYRVIYTGSQREALREQLESQLTNARKSDNELADKLEALLAKATKGEWSVDYERNDAEYGDGPDAHSGFNSYFIGTDAGRICDTLNAEVGFVEEEWDEHGCQASDYQGKHNMELVSALVNNAPAIIEALRKP